MGSVAASAGSVSEAVAVGREAVAVEGRIGVGAHAEAMLGERGLMSIDEGHAIGVRIAAGAAFAQGQRLHRGRNCVRDEVGDAPQPLAVGGEGRMHVEAVAPAGARRVGAGQSRMAVGHVDDAGQIAADERLERGAQLDEIRPADRCPGLFANPPPMAIAPPRPNRMRSVVDSR